MQAAGSSIAMRAEALAGVGRVFEAVQLLSSAQAAADGDALFTLAVWRVAGEFLPRDLGIAKELFRRSAAAGRRDAAHIHVAFTAHGAGGAPQWETALAMLRALARSDKGAARQLDLIDKMSLTRHGDPVKAPKGEPLSSAPDVSAFPRLLTAQECAFLIDLALPQLQPSIVVDPSTGRQIRNPVRTSDSMGFPLFSENPAVYALNRRFAAASGTEVSQGEPLQVLRYSPGQEYRSHLDALPAASNQRILTLLVYLNDNYQGGETSFVRTGLKFKGKTGDALLFRNALPDQRPDPLSQHAGLPVSRGVKLLASRWIRARPIDLMKPLN